MGGDSYIDDNEFDEFSSYWELRVKALCDLDKKLFPDKIQEPIPEDEEYKKNITPIDWYAPSPRLNTIQGCGGHLWYSNISGGNKRVAIHNTDIDTTNHNHTAEEWKALTFEQKQVEVAWWIKVGQYDPRYQFKGFPEPEKNVSSFPRNNSIYS